MVSVRMETARTESFLQERVGLQAFDAIRLNHIKRVRLFLKNGVNANMRDSQKRTLLMCSCSLANQDAALKFVNLLLSYEARIGSSDVGGRNALHHAVLNRQPRVVSRFLEFSGNFDINSQDDDGNTALMLAVLTRNVLVSERITEALRRYDLSVDICNKKGITPLIQATILEENEIAECLMVVGRASKQIRDTHFRKSASEWERTGSKRKGNVSSNSYPARIRAIHASPMQVLRLKNCGQENLDMPAPELLNRDATSTREYSLARNARSHDTSFAAESYNWPDLKRVYGLYEQQLASSYRRSVPARTKTPPPSEPSSEGRSLWRKTDLAMKLRQRRHTIAFTRSLPNNLSTKFLFARRSVPDGRIVGRSSNAAGKTDLDDAGAKWPLLRHGCSKRNLQHRKSDFGQLPSTAPSGLDSCLLSNRNEVRKRSTTSMENVRLARRHSVSFHESLEMGADQGEVSLQSSQTRRSSLTKNGEGGLRSGASETSLPIFELEEELQAENDHHERPDKA